MHSTYTLHILRIHWNASSSSSLSSPSSSQETNYLRIFLHNTRLGGCNVQRKPNKQTREEEKNEEQQTNKHHKCVEQKQQLVN